MSKHFSDEFVDFINKHKHLLKTEEQCGKFVNVMFDKLKKDDNKSDMAYDLIRLIVEDAGINIFPYLDTIKVGEFFNSNTSKVDFKLNLINCVEIQENGFSFSDVKEIFAPKCVKLYENALYGSDLKKFEGSNIKEVLGVHVFYSTYIKKIDFPKCDIFHARLEDCSLLEYVKLDSIQEIDGLYLFNAKNLKTLILPECKKTLRAGMDSPELFRYGFENLELLVINDNVDNKESIEELQKTKPNLQIQYV